MSQALRTAVFSTIIAGLFFLVPSAAADGRSDWQGYAWRKIDIADCQPATSGTLTCPTFHEKWDWKRDQWVDIAIAIDPATHHLRLVQQLTDNDRSDSDHVCVTVLVVDASGRNLIAHHQNWHISSGERPVKAFDYTSSAIAEAAAIHIGSKQCRKGAGQDDNTYATVLAGIAR